MSKPTGTPLARLFAVGYRTLIEGLHEQLRSRGWTDVRPAFGFVLLAARDTTSVTDLATLMGMTKQATSKLVDGMVSAGYIERSTSTEDARRQNIGLTRRGRTLLDEVEAIYEEMEERWAMAIGRKRVERLRADLEGLLTDPTTERLPPVRPLW